MALINKVLPGFVATLWCQTGSTPTPLTATQLSTWTSQVGDIVGTSAGGTGTDGIEVPVEVIPPFGADDAFAAYSIAGQRTGAKITTQNQVTSMTITCPWNPASLAHIRANANCSLPISRITFPDTSFDVLTSPSIEESKDRKSVV